MIVRKFTLQQFELVAPQPVFVSNGTLEFLIVLRSLYIFKVANEWKLIFLWHFSLMDNMILHNVCG
jgi:hypothetical protein